MRAEALMSLSRLPSNDPQKLQTRTALGVEWPALLFWPAEISPYLNMVRKDPRLQQIAKDVLGPDIVQLNNQIYYRLPGDGDQFTWHQDISFRTPREAFSQIEDGYLQTIIAIDGVDEHNGGVEFIPGSHKTGDQDLVPRDGTEKGLRRFERNGLRGRKMSGNPGDVFVWSVMVVHGSEPNISDRSRMTYMNGFAKASSVSKSLGFPTYMKGGVVR